MSPRLRTSAMGFLTMQLVCSTRTRSVRHQDACLSFGGCSSVSQHARDSPVPEASQGSLNTRQDGYRRTVDNPLSRAAGSKHRPIDRIYTAAGALIQLRTQANASLAKQQERAVATSIVHSAAAAKPQVAHSAAHKR